MNVQFRGFFLLYFYLIEVSSVIAFSQSSGTGAVMCHLTLTPFILNLISNCSLFDTLLIIR